MLNDRMKRIGSTVILAGFVILWTVIAVTGCISVPSTNAMVSQRGTSVITSSPLSCDVVSTPESARAGGNAELNSRGFRVMTWNVMKNVEEGWKDDFLRVGRDNDILVMQEAFLTGDLRGVLENGIYAWDLSVAYTFMTTEAGVLTASLVRPDFLCTLRSEEPLIKTPKMILMTRYPLSGTNISLLVVNIHSINFTLDSAIFAEQLKQIEPIVAAHRGPVIVAGDFNTWSDDRAAIVESTIDSLGLSEVRFDDDNRTTFFGHRVDYIYYRGLEYDEASVFRVETSDHNPMTVTFRLADDQYAIR
jgi:endonuclease/exonuclease/phosphatase (EEP) superfamily protein YafD